MSFIIPNNAKKILNTLHQHGFKAYLVGGCVRDYFMNKTPNDYDICTNALPEECIKLFEKNIVSLSGLKHGTITVVYDKVPYEITTFRTDGEYNDNRHPNKVNFVTNINDDLLRRDFTINALAYNEETGIVDIFNSENDIKNKIIRCVGNPDTRFKEDALRILRALRFSSQLGFKINNQTKASIYKNKELLKNISSERIAIEFNKLLTGNNVYNVLNEYKDIIAVFIPEIKDCFGFKQFTKHHCYDVYTHIIKSVGLIENDLILRITMFFHDIAKPECFVYEKLSGHFYCHQIPSAKMSKIILKRLKYSKKIIDSVYDLILEHDNRYEANPKYIKKYLNKFGTEFFFNQNKVRLADTLAQSDYMRKEKIDLIYNVIKTGEKIIAEKNCISIKDLNINGEDLINIGYKQGPEIGIILNEILEKIIDGGLSNTKEELIKFAKNKHYIL